MTLSRSSFLPICLTALFGAACGRGGPQAAAPAEPPGMPVKTQAVAIKKIPDYTEYIATLQARGSAVLQPHVEGLVTKILVRSGQHVKAGEPLLVIDPRVQEASVNSTEASLRTKQATLEYDRLDLERKKRLFAEGVVARQELDQSQTAFDAAMADV